MNCRVLIFVFFALQFNVAVAQQKHDHEGGRSPDGGSVNFLDIVKNAQTNARRLDRDTFLADIQIRRQQVEEQFKQGDIDNAGLVVELATIRQELIEIDAREDAIQVAMRIGDMPEAPPRARALAWFDVAKVVSKTSGGSETVFAGAAEAYELAVECLNEIPPEQREKQDYELEGSARSWLALSCDVAGNKQRAMEERLKILVDKELCANTNPSVVVGVFQSFTNYYEEQGDYNSAEAMRAASANYLVDRADDFDPQQKLAVGLGLVANAKTVPLKYRLKLLEELWDEPALKDNLLILKVGNDLGLYYFFDAGSEKLREPFFNEMLSRCERILQPSKFPNGEKNKVFEELKNIEIQALVLALETTKKSADSDEWNDRLRENFGRFGRSVTFPENHPQANDVNLKHLVKLVTKYFTELKPIAK